jgi:outer membrane lipase/esterase
MRCKRNELLPKEEELDEPFGPPPMEYPYRCAVCGTELVVNEAMIDDIWYVTTKLFTSDLCCDWTHSSKEKNMTGVQPMRCTRQSTSFQVPYWRNHTALQWWEKGSALLLSLVMLSAIVLITSLCIVSPGQAQTPEAVFGTAIYTGPQPICPRLNDQSQTPLSARLPGTGTEDLRLRCNELAPTQQPEVLRQVASEEVATQGRNAVETSTKTIGARLAALRRGASGINIQGLGVNSKEPTLPGTLVAALGPFAAVSSTTPTTNTPSPFNGLGLFANGNFSVGDRDPTSNEAGFDFHTYGVIAGLDYRFTPKLVLGGAFTYQSTTNDLDNTMTLVRGVLTSVNGGSADTRSYGFSLYGTYYVLEQLYVDGILGFGWNDYRLDRVIRYGLGVIPSGETPPVNQIARTDTNGHQFSFSVGAGYDFKQGALTFGPLARLQYLKLNIDGYQEKINNTQPGFGWALALDSQDVESLTMVLGGRASYAISTGLGVLLPQVRIEWEHEFKDNSRLITARFVNDPQRQPIRFSTDSPDRDYVNIGVALSATFRGGIAAFVDYETVLALANVTRHDITLGIRGEF